jgi:hypothetical protein
MGGACSAYGGEGSLLTSILGQTNTVHTNSHLIHTNFNIILPRQLSLALFFPNMRNYLKEKVTFITLQKILYEEEGDVKGDSDKGWSSSLRNGRVPNNSSPSKYVCYWVSGIDGLCGTDQGM